MTPILTLWQYEHALGMQAQDAVRDAVAKWFTTYRVHGRSEPIPGDVLAFLIGTQGIVSGVVTYLDYLGNLVDYRLATYEQVLGDARAAIRNTALQLWPGAQYPIRGGVRPPAPAVEFECYRLGASDLLQRLDAIYLACVAGRQGPPPPPSATSVYPQVRPNGQTPSPAVPALPMYAQPSGQRAGVAGVGASTTTEEATR